MLTAYAKWLGAGTSNSQVGTFREVRGAGTKTAKDSCLNHLFVHVDLGGTLGVANLDVTCAFFSYGGTAANVGFSTTLSNGEVAPQWQTVSVTTHELGHSFGAEHDCIIKGASLADLEDDRQLPCPGYSFGSDDGTCAFISFVLLSAPCNAA